MVLLSAIGLLALISIAILILIYILKPNYLQKRVSSTYVWKLSLKYKKKKIPISKLRNILIIICQILILTSCALILAQPNKVNKEPVQQTEVIAIIDSSASMRTVCDGVSRFDRAVNSVLQDVDDVFGQNGIVSVIVANTAPDFLLHKERITLDTKLTNDAGEEESASAKLINSLEDLKQDAESCSYGVADIESAIELSKKVLEVNPETIINLYTDNTYIVVPDGINIVNITDEVEWNAAILNAYAVSEDNYYAFYVDVACFGRESEVVINLEVQNANALDSTGDGLTFTYQKTVSCSRDQTKTVIFKYFGEEDEVPTFDEDDSIVYYYIDNMDKAYSYQSVHIYLEDDDNFVYDNNFDIYGGQKPVIKVQYASDSSTAFFNGILFVLREAYRDRWDIQLTEVKLNLDQEAAIEGFDFYIYENEMPKNLPIDGIVMLVNPKDSVAGEFDLIGTTDFMGFSLPLAEGEIHPITNGVAADKITVSRYARIRPNATYKTLLTCQADPVLLVQDEEDSKVVIVSFSSGYSNLTISLDFPLLMYNIFEHFIPCTVKGNAFEVYDKININARGNALSVSNADGQIEAEFTEFPNTFSTTLPGAYELYQTFFFDKEVTEKIYVKIPAEESNIWMVVDKISDPFGQKEDFDYFTDLLIYIAAAFVALLFLEWLLHNLEEA